MFNGEIKDKFEWSQYNENETSYEQQSQSNTIEAITENSIEVHTDSEIKADNKPDDNVNNQQDETVELIVIVNENPIVLKGKKSYVFVDIFDIDLSKVHGKGLVTKLNSMPTSGFIQPLNSYDKIEVYWEE